MNKEQVLASMVSAEPCLYQLDNGDWVPVHITKYDEIPDKTRITARQVFTTEKMPEYGIAPLASLPMMGKPFTVSFDPDRFASRVVDSTPNTPIQ